ncbi:MAG: hypothetical protein IT577_24605, partial [Verrucomicrobiae bacterium]|nr:hypothetical protein [Verrucomicrobiae bacterium]
FVSEEFAAAATVEAPDAFRFENLGNVALAKNWGTCRLYSLGGAEDPGMPEFP